MPILQKYLPYNRLQPYQIFTVRGLVTHDSPDVGDGLQGLVASISNRDKNADSIL